MAAPGHDQGHAFLGVRVVDLSSHPGGALAAMHLGEFGADVVRPDAGDATPLDADRPFALYAHRNKRHVAGDGRELLRGADVVVVDRPLDVLHTTGLTSEQLRGADPALIHAWMPPHAPRGSASALPADELLLQAWTGMADQQPGATSDQPVAPVVPILAYEQGALGAAAIAAALVQRAATGTGRGLTVSGLHSVAAMNTTIMLDLPGIIRPFGAQKDGTGASPVFRMYRCRDGHWVFLCALTPNFLFKLLEVLDLMDLVMADGIEGDIARLMVPEIQQRVGAEFARVVGGRDLAEWERIFEAAGVPYAPVSSRDTWAAGETVAANKLLCSVVHREHGATTMPDVPLVLSATPGRVALDPAAPSPGPRDPHGTAGAAPVDPTLPLTGVVVVDATKFVAGPFAGLLLRDLGATVVKVEPVGGEEFRAVAGASYSALNRDKAQVALDLAAPAGHDAFTTLVARADVLVENMSDKVMESLRLDPARFRADNPGLVHCHIDAWGAGPLDGSPAFDPLLQARSGLMVAQGGPDTPVIQAPSVHDIGTGTLAVFGVLAALHARPRLGTGQDVGVSLSRTSVTFQGAEFTTYASRPPAPLGRLGLLGDGPAHSMYRSADGWVAIGARAGAGIDGWPAALARIAGDTEDEVAAFCADRTVRAVLDACTEAGIPAVRVLPRDEIYRAGDLAANDFFTIVDDDDLGEIVAVRGFSDWEGVAPRARARNRARGVDTVQMTDQSGSL